MRDFKKCDITYLLRKIDLEMLPHLKIASGSFIYYVINVYVPRVRANAYHVLTTPPRVFRDPKMCLRNIWTAPYHKGQTLCLPNSPSLMLCRGPNFTLRDLGVNARLA